MGRPPLQKAEESGTERKAEWTRGEGVMKESTRRRHDGVQDSGEDNI